MNNFLNTTFGIIGKVVATRQDPNTTSMFNFWITNNEEITAKIEVGNIVAAYYENDSNADITFGVISEMSSFSDVDSAISDYLSHDFGKAEVDVPTNVPRIIVVTCRVMKNLSGKIKPVEKAHVYFPSEIGIQVAYGILNEKGESTYKGNAIPVGVFENGDGTQAVIKIDEFFLCGPEGAHLNVSGVSGLASKTSSIEFLIKSSMKYLSCDTAFLVFNVKSKDLLYLERPNTKLQTHDWSKEAYRIMDLDTTPFTTARYYAPADPDNKQNSVSLRTSNVTPFYWNFSEMRDNLPSLFDENDWDDKMEGVWYVIDNHMADNATYDELLTWVKERIRGASTNGTGWALGYHVATWNKMYSHLKRIPSTYSGLISMDQTTQGVDLLNLRKNDVVVIDMHMVDDKGQKLIFSKVINALDRHLKNKQLRHVKQVVVFVDELNKYAPSGRSRSPLKSQLINITARGRSMGLILFGAQQFASSIEKEVIENSSTFFFGRTGSNEIHSQFYSELSQAVKTKLLTLQNGTLLIKFPKFPQPIFIKFPFPVCEPGDEVTS